MKALPRASPLYGADGARPWGSAGCLTIESETCRRKTGVPTGNRTRVFTVKG